MRPGLDLPVTYDVPVMLWWPAFAAAVALLIAATALATGFVVGRRTAGYDAASSGRRSVMERAFAAAPAAQVVVASDGSVLVANRTARDLGLTTDAGGLDDRVAERVLATFGTVGAHGDELRARSGTETWETAGLRDEGLVLRVWARSIGGGAILVTATDETAAHATELIRRDFVANVSHELKSPVTAVGLLAEAIEAAADSPETVRSFAGRIEREASRLGALITEIIALSAIQDGALHDVDRVRIDAVIADAVDRATVPATGAGIELVVGEPSGAEVMGDRGLLTTALGNLIDNAVHYSEAGSRVTISQVVRRGIVDIAVADSGIGISPRDQRRVFERFFRADPARSRATGGTGLGLAIVKHAAANHHGSIRLASRLGVGSTFTLRLPLAGTVPDPELIGDRAVAWEPVAAPVAGSPDTQGDE